MLNFNHQSFILKRPITIPSIAVALDVKPYSIMAEFIGLDFFPGPEKIIPDPYIYTLGNRIAAEFTIEEGN